MSRILVIDDDPEVRQMLRKMLERAGYDVAEATDGKMAMKHYLAQPADLIITDLIMPEKDGIETITDFRRNSPAVKIIAISGGGRYTASDNYLYIAKRLGAHHVLEKPFNHKELLKVIQQLLVNKAEG